MKRLNKIVVALSLVVAISAGSGSVLAKSNGAKRRILSAVITSVDRQERTVTVRELGSDRVFKLQLPAGQGLKTMHPSPSHATIEYLMAGMVVRDVAVQ